MFRETWLHFPIALLSLKDTGARSVRERIHAPSVLEQRGVYYIFCFATLFKSQSSSSSRARVAVET